MTRYDAFVSYSHSADGAFAPSVKAGLQRFAKPWFKRRSLHVFLDGANLNLSPHLWSSIERALDGSEHFLYLASAEAAASKWVQQELAYWCAQGRADRLLVIVTGGELAWDTAANDFDWSRTTCMPRSMSGVLKGEPLFLDLRWAKAAPDLSLQNPKFKQAIALLSATLKGQTVEDMIGEEVEQHRRTIRLRNAAVVTLMVLLVASAVAAFIAFRQRAEAVSQRDRAVVESLRNRVRADLEAGAMAQAARTALASAAHFGADPSAQQALIDVATHTSPVLATFAEPLGSQPSVEFSGDGLRILSTIRGGDLTLGPIAGRVIDLRGHLLRSFVGAISAQWLPGGEWFVMHSGGAMSRMQMSDGSGCGGSGMRALVPMAGETAAGVQASAPQKVGHGFLALAPDGRRQLSVCGNFLVFGEPAGTMLRWRLPSIVSARLSPDGRRIAAVFSHTTAVLPADSGAATSEGAEPARSSLVELSGVNPVFDPDGNAIATVEKGNTWLWSLEGRSLGLRKGVGPVFGPGGMLLTEAGGATWLWHGGQAEVRIDGVAPRVSRDGRWIMTTITGGRTLVSEGGGHALTVLDGTSGRFVPGAPAAMTANSQGQIRIWDLRRLAASTAEAAAQAWGIPIDELRGLGSKDGDHACAEGPERLEGLTEKRLCSPDGVTRVDIVGIPGVIPGRSDRSTWVFHRGEPLVRPPEQPSLTELTKWRPSNAIEADDQCVLPLARVEFSPVADHDTAFGCGDGTVRVFDGKGRGLRWRGAHSAADPNSLAESRDYDSMLSLTGRRAPAVLHVAFSPDGQRLLSGSADGSARLWGAHKGERLLELTGHESGVIGSDFNQDGAHLATLTNQGVLRLWHTADRHSRLLATMRLSDDVITRIAFSRDGDWIIAHTRQGRWHAWLARPAKLAQHFAWLDGLTDAERTELGLR